MLICYVCTVLLTSLRKCIKNFVGVLFSEVLKNLKYVFEYIRSIFILLLKYFYSSTSQIRSLIYNRLLQSVL